MPSASVHLWFDPDCPWTWITSRWLVAASFERDLTITWHPYSLQMKKGGGGHEQGHRALRVIIRLRDEVGNNAANAFYTERGHRMFGGSGEVDPAAVLEGAGLDLAYARAAADASLDPTIQAEMDEAHRLAGDSNGSPVLALEGVDHGFFGPVLTAVPADPGGLWDVIAGMFTVVELQELKRDRRAARSFPDRPLALTATDR